MRSSLSSSLSWAKGECQIHGEYRSVILPGHQASCPECAKEAQDAREKREAEERKAAQAADKFAASGIPPFFREASLANYLITSTDPAQKRALDVCVAYCADIENALKTGRSMIFLGNVGTGKTHLAVGIIREVFARGLTAKMTTIADYFRACKETWGRKADLSEMQVLDSYFSPDLLVIDEVGIQFGTKTEIDLTFGLINKRYNHAKPNVIIANLDKSELKEYLGEPVYDRLKGGVIVYFPWESARGLDLSKFSQTNHVAMGV